MLKEKKRNRTDAQILIQTIVLSALILVTGSLAAQPIFRSGMEDPDIPPLFPKESGIFQLPDEGAANQLAWLLAELAEPNLGSTSTTEINNHFSAGWLAVNDATATQAFIHAVRTDFPSAIVTDIVGITPMSLNVFIQGQDANQNTGFLSLTASYSGNQVITSLGVTPHNGNLQYPADQSLTMEQAISNFSALAAETAVLVAYIEDGACHAAWSHNANALLATGSLFKPWVLGGLADEVMAGNLDPDQNVAFDANERVNGGSEINYEPNGTLFTLRDLAVMMIGVSDNSATDLVHEVTGRANIDDYIARSGVNDPGVLSPLLSVNEQFHLFFSFNLATSTSYLNDSEANQLAFINNSIVPLGPVSSYPFNNTTLLTDGSWRASTMDICANFATLREFPKGSVAMQLVDRVMGAQAAQVGVRNHWDRVWYKGGSLSSGSGYHVLTHGWLVESNGRPPWVVIGMTNDGSGGIEDDDGLFKIQSLLSRILELVAESQS